jgi:hypothetical protein
MNSEKKSNKNLFFPDLSFMENKFDLILIFFFDHYFLGYACASHAIPI